MQPLNLWYEDRKLPILKAILTAKGNDLAKWKSQAIKTSNFCTLRANESVQNLAPRLENRKLSALSALSISTRRNWARHLIGRNCDRVAIRLREVQLLLGCREVGMIPEAVVLDRRNLIVDVKRRLRISNLQMVETLIADLIHQIARRQ